MYYILDCERLADDEGGYLEVDDAVNVDLDLEDWSLGLRLDLKPEEPFQLAARAVRGYNGPPSDLYDFRVCLMSARMVQALREAGVDNLEVYPAFLVENQAGARWPAFVVNIIGRVAAADLAQSDWSSLDETALGDVHFERVVLDPNAGAGLLMFRLAENLRTILIHERVKVCLERAGLAGVVFVDPGEWQT